MPLPDIIISSPYVVVTLSASPTGVVPNSKGFVIGYVEMVNQLSDKVATGQYVMFNKELTESFIYGSTVYYRVDENDILFQENTPL